MYEKTKNSFLKCFIAKLTNCFSRPLQKNRKSNKQDDEITYFTCIYTFMLYEVNRLNEIYLTKFRKA